MDFIEIAAYLGAILIGVVLGLIGGGGSILTIPIFVYILHINPVVATGYSLFVVGSVALVGAIFSAKKGLIAYKTGIIFSIPTFAAVYVTRKYMVPAIPNEIVTIGEFVITKGLAIMLFFAFVMILASYSMIKGRKENEEVGEIKLNYTKITLQGIGVGIVTGLVGAGGGFLIIPALVLLAKLPMKNAVATSLMIIAINSLIGFLGDVQNLVIDWKFLLSFTGIAIVGIFLGMYASKFIAGYKLKKGFGWFVLVMGIYIVFREIFLTN